MLDCFFVMPETIDRIRSSWIGEPVERYVAWMAERRFALRTIVRRVPLLLRFGEFARQQGAASVEDLPACVKPFVEQWVAQRIERAPAQRRKTLSKEVQGPIAQLLRVVLSDSGGRRRGRQPENPFHGQVPGFFDYLRSERGLRETTVSHYAHHLREFAGFLKKSGWTICGIFRRRCSVGSSSNFSGALLFPV